MRPLGYEPYDVCLWRRGQSLADAVTSADGTKHVPLVPSRLSPLTRFRRARFTNRFTEQAIDLRFPPSLPFLSAAAIPWAAAPSQAWSRRRPQRTRKPQLTRNMGGYSLWSPR